MIRRTVLTTVIIALTLQIFSGDAAAFWWLFKKKKVEPPVALPPVMYSIGNDRYRHDYGDAVRVADSESEFVICDSCPKPSSLERELKPVPITLRLSMPAAPAPAAPAGNSLPMVSAAAPERIDANEKASPMSQAVDRSEHEKPETDSPVACKELTVYFDLGSSKVREEDQLRIETFSKGLTGKEEVLINGYTCDIGGKPFNDRLALDRAEAVAGIIEKCGSVKVSVAGEGKCCYVSEDKSLNRRVEIRCKVNN